MAGESLLGDEAFAAISSRARNEGPSWIVGEGRRFVVVVVGQVDGCGRCYRRGGRRR